MEQRFPKQFVFMPSYLIGETEVTAENFFKVMGSYPKKMQVQGPVTPDKVATNVSWIEAVEYCERIGARLPTYNEYLFAATNRGTTPFPFGSTIPFEDWKIGEIKQPASDITITTPPIYNLFSSVGEWAWDINVSKDPKGPSQMIDPRFSPMIDARLVLCLLYTSDAADE